MRKEFGVGIIGFGTVGAGVVECLLRNGELIGRRTGVHPRIVRIADLDIVSDRGVAVDPDWLTTDAAALIADPAVDVVVELVGGTSAALDFILAALAAGKPVVTANKALLAEHGDRVFEAAAAARQDVFYEASVGGGIPIIKAMREGLVGNRINSVVGILNGTCNYILTRMEAEGAPFDEVLAAAQAAGYAEADSGFDIDGWDTAHKASIIASLAYGEWFGMKPLHVEGVRNISLRDIRYAKRLGYRIKLLAVVRQEAGDVQIRVHPALLSTDSMLGNVGGVFNAIMVCGDPVGETLYYGRGAGREATASAVVADILDVGLNLAADSARRIEAFRPHEGFGGIIPIERIRTRYYLRLQLVNRPGVLCRVARVLGDLDISLASVNQQESDEAAEGMEPAAVPVVILTHEACEKDMQSALVQLRELDVVAEPPVMLRIEDLG